jgi:replication-associated recombination protein RarA
MTLFDLSDNDKPTAGPDATLAERMRPRTLEVFVVPDQLVGDGRLVKRLIDGKGPLPS